MNNTLKSALIQTEVVWEEPTKNLNNFSEKIEKMDPDVDLIILPELFSTGFTMDADRVAEEMDGITVKWMLEKSNNRQCVILGSVLIKEGGKFYNRMIVTFPNGEIKHYDKRHLFSYAKEDKVFSQGEDRLVFNYKGFNICPLICYDLRFPVWARNTEYIDILIYSANWPKPRIKAWDTLLKSRAIENMCYTIGVNRVGTDKNNLIFPGHSAAYNCLGETILEFDENEEAEKTVVLKKDHITEIRNKFRFLDDRDEFKIKTSLKN